MSKVPCENRVPSKAKRSALPRLSTKIPTQASSGYFSVRSPHSKYQSSNTKRSFSQNDKSPEPSFEYDRLPDQPWRRHDPEDDPNSNWAATDATSPFSRQLAKITRGSTEDIWEAACRPMLPVPRPAWPADGGHVNRKIEFKTLSKEAIGKLVVVAGKEVGILKYYGRTAFASGIWCGVELESPFGKNDGSVDGVIYFTCPIQHGIFAPEDKVALLPHSPEMPAKRLKYENQRIDPTFRLSTASTCSNSSSNSALSQDSAKRLSSESSSATYTICGRTPDSFPGTPEELKPVIRLKRIHSSQEEANSDIISPSGTYDDSSLGILSPEQMVNIIGKSPSDENIGALQDEIFEEGAVGGATMHKWDPEDTLEPLSEEIFQNDISAILQELQRTDSSSSPSVKSPVGSQGDEEDSSQNVPHVNPVVNTRSNKKLSFNIKTDAERRNESEKNSRSASSWGHESVENMTTSAVSLDQGYQGDGEFDAPSEAGSVTASSPTETDRQFKETPHETRFSIYPADIDVSLADDETESDTSFMPGDRRARIIDGKLYHNHKELTGIKPFDGKTHDTHSSEMDSSGFYSDLDPRDDDSKMEISLLRPLEEGRTEMDFNDSVIDDATRCDETHALESDDSTSDAISNNKSHKSERSSSPSSPVPSIIEEVATKEANTSTTEQVPSRNTFITDAGSLSGNGLQIEGTIQNEHIRTPPENEVTTEQKHTEVEESQESTQTPPKPRLYEKPWKSKPAVLKRPEKPKIVLPPPPPMPKKNVQSKLKMMLESSEPSHEDRRQRQQKKGRWDDVMNRIEEGKKEDSLRPKVKQVKSRLLENLKSPQPPSPQVEKMRQERKERRERRERQTAGVRRASERKRSIASNRNSRAPSTESLAGIPATSIVNSEASTPDISHKSGSSIDKTRNSTPTKRKNLETVKIKNLRNSNLQNSQRISDPVKVAKPSIVNGSQLRSSLPPQQTKRHEALLAAKNAELLVAREESRKAQTGIEALSVLIQHLTTKYEPFKTAHFKKKIDNLCNELTNLRLCLDESKANVQRLEDEASRRCQLHTEEVLLLQEKLTQETQTLKDDHEQEIFNINQSHQRELRKVTEDHETQLTCKTKEHESKLETVDTEWRKQMEEQHHRHLHAQEQLSSCHKQQLDEAEKRWASEHKTLEEVNSKLKNDNKHLKEQAKTLEQTLLSDKDSKLQAAKRVCTGLQSEVDSLKTVLDMRNAELHRLRDQVADKERLCEDLDSSREKVRFLRAKTEDLQAQMQTKSEIEKQRMAEYMKLHESHQRELALNQTLNHHNEELQWKLRQRGDFSVSLPNTTPDSTHRLSRSTDNQSWTKLSTSTPRMNSQGSNRRTANKNQENDSEYSMESPPLSPCVKGFLEKSTSVSFTYNLNDPACEDDLRDISISPIHRKGSRTVTRKRAPSNQLEKSMSSPYVSGRTAKVKTSSRNGTKACTSTPRPKSLHFKGAKVNGKSNKLSEEPLFRRSTSGGGDGDPDRLSPSAWSIQSNCSNKSFGQEGQKPSFLQHAEEDEYEESDEFVQVLDLTDGLNGGSLSAILGNTPTSISLSDSDASQCGSRLELTDDTDDDTELDWVPQQDAGEAMVPQGPDATNQASSVVSSDSEEPKNGITWSPEQSCELTSSSEMQDLL